MEELNSLLLADGGLFAACFFSCLFSFRHPLAPLHCRGGLSSAPHVHYQGFLYSNDRCRKRMQLWAGRKREPRCTRLLWGGLAVKVGVAFGQKAECPPPPPVKAPSLENIMWIDLINPMGEKPILVNSRFPKCNWPQNPSVTRWVACVHACVCETGSLWYYCSMKLTLEFVV